MDKDLKFISIMGTVVGILAATFIMFYFIGYEYGQRAEHKKTQQLVKQNMALENDLGTYKIYYQCAEDLLDTIAKYDNWPDKYDPTEYYDIMAVINECAE